VNVQVIADPAGRLIWAVAALARLRARPDRGSDTTASPMPLTSANVMTFADEVYQGRPWQRPDAVPNATATGRNCPTRRKPSTAAPPAANAPNATQGLESPDQTTLLPHPARPRSCRPSSSYTT